MKRTALVIGSFLAFFLFLQGDARLQTTETLPIAGTSTVGAATNELVSPVSGEKSAVFQPIYDPIDLPNLTPPAAPATGGQVPLNQGALTLESLELTVHALSQRIENLDRRLAQVENTLSRNPQAGVPQMGQPNLPPGAIGQPVIGGGGNQNRGAIRERDAELKSRGGTGAIRQRDSELRSRGRTNSAIPEETERADSPFERSVPKTGK